MILYTMIFIRLFYTSFVQISTSLNRITRVITQIGTLRMSKAGTCTMYMFKLSFRSKLCKIQLPVTFCIIIGNEREIIPVMTLFLKMIIGHYILALPIFNYPTVRVEFVNMKSYA